MSPILIHRLALAAGLLLASAATAANVEKPHVFPSDFDEARALADGARLPVPVQMVAPVDPPETAALTYTQRVFLAFVVTHEGKVERVSAMFDPPPAFARAAIAAAAQWRFEPGLHYDSSGSGKMIPVSTQMTVLVTFSPPAQPAAPQ